MDSLNLNRYLHEDLSNDELPPHVTIFFGRFSLRLDSVLEGEGKKELKTPQQIQLEKKQREKNKLKQKLGRYRWIRENLGIWQNNA